MEKIKIQFQKDKKEIKPSHFRIRELLGWLGMLLPFILIIGQIITVENPRKGPVFLNSISHYHYSNVGIIFTGVLMSFALLLISYKGIEDKSKYLTDNNITNLAGVLAIIVVLIPTKYAVGLEHTPNCHSSDFLSNIHLISAGAFLSLLLVLLLVLILIIVSFFGWKLLRFFSLDFHGY